MAEINIDVEKLNSKINKLKQIESRIQNINMKPDSVVGGGESIEVLHSISKQYEIIQQSMLTLINDSINFFENVENSFVSSDNTAASKIK